MPPRDALPAYRRRIGVVFQDFRLVRHLSAFDNVALPLRIAGKSEEEIEGPVREMLAWVGLADRASARPPTLSGGEQQRVAIARAVIAIPTYHCRRADRQCRCGNGGADAPPAHRDEPAGHNGHCRDPRCRTDCGDARRAAYPAGERRIGRPDRGVEASTGDASDGQDVMNQLFATDAEKRLIPSSGMRGPVPLLIAIMTFVIVVVAAAGLALSNTSSVVKAGVEHRYSIQISDGAAKAPAAIAAARRMPEISRVQQVAPERSP